MEVTLAGIVISLMPVFRNALSPIVCSADPTANLTDLNSGLS